MSRRVIRIPMTKARINLGALVREVNTQGDIVVLEKDGIPVAGLVDIDAIEDFLDAHDPDLQKQIKESMKEYRAGRARPLQELLDELATESR